MSSERQHGMSRRAFLRNSALLAAGSLLLAACPAPTGSAPAAQGGANAPAAEGVTVEWWHGWGGTVALGTLQKVADAFNAQSTAFKVKRTQVDSVSDKLLTAIAGGTPPDVETGNIAYSEFYSRDSMQPLDDRIEASKVIDKKDIFASS